MTERNLAGELAMLATEVDSLAKALVLARGELARENQRRERAEAKSEELRHELGQARRRAQTAERELGKLSANAKASAHTAEGYQHELKTRLEQAQKSNQLLRLEVERKERQRRTLEENLKEVMENLRNAAQEVRGSADVANAPFAEEATLVPPTRDDSGW